MKQSYKEPNSKIIIISFIIPIILQLTFFIFQAFNKVFSIWNIFSTAMVIGIFINAVKMSRKKDKNIKQLNSDHISSGSTIDYSILPQKKTSKRSFAIKLIVSILALALSILFFNIHNNKSKGLQLINSTVISQQGETIIETEETDDGITQSEKDHIEVIVEYEYNGSTKQAKITGGTTHKIHVDELKIYIDKNGEFVSDYGRILIWKIEAIIFLFTAIMFTLILIFSLDVEFIAGTIFLFVGFALFFVVGCQFIENIWFNDLSCFFTAFINIAIYMLIMGILNLFLHKKEKSITEPISQEQSLQNLKERLNKKYNNTQTNIEEHNKTTETIACKNCGAPISKAHKFCEQCGTKKD